MANLAKTGHSVEAQFPVHKTHLKRNQNAQI
jgi:hypothetical protein